MSVLCWCVFVLSLPRSIVVCVWVCVYGGGVVDVVECVFFSLGVCGWIVSLCSGCYAFRLVCDA